MWGAWGGWCPWRSAMNSTYLRASRASTDRDIEVPSSKLPSQLQLERCAATWANTQVRPRSFVSNLSTDRPGLSWTTPATGGRNGPVTRAYRVRDRPPGVGCRSVLADDDIGTWQLAVFA